MCPSHLATRHACYPYSWLAFDRAITVVNPVPEGPARTRCTMIAELLLTITIRGNAQLPTAEVQYRESDRTYRASEWVCLARFGAGERAQSPGAASQLGRWCQVCAPAPGESVPHGRYPQACLGGARVDLVPPIGGKVRDQQAKTIKQGRVGLSMCDRKCSLAQISERAQIQEPKLSTAWVLKALGSRHNHRGRTATASARVAQGFGGMSRLTTQTAGGFSKRNARVGREGGEVRMGKAHARQKHALSSTLQHHNPE
jgi:hypothetical protein